MNFSTEHWANHQRGQKKRAEISLYLSQNPNATSQEIAEAVNLSIWQVKRHLSKIHSERGMSSVAIASALVICSGSIFSQCLICSVDTENNSFLTYETLKNPSQKTPYSS